MRFMSRGVVAGKTARTVEVAHVVEQYKSQNTSFCDITTFVIK
jgi:hypothetical protein